MNSMATEDTRLATPQGHGSSLVEPDWPCVGSLLAANQSTLLTTTAEILGTPLAEFAQTARAELLAAASAYTSSYRTDVPPQFDPATKIIISGHQPELFHPGVWFKNFALHYLSAKHQAVGVHLLIDNDLVQIPALKSPAGSLQSPTTQLIPIDAAAEPMPFEERRILDRKLFDSFAQRVAENLTPFVERPVLSELWPLAVAAADQGNDNLGQCISQARHLLEAAWGIDNLEVPLSHLCRGDAFANFAAHVLCHLKEFRQLYNAAIHDYRVRHRLRSHSHPAPELCLDGESLEAPFWIWSADQTTRWPLYVRHHERQGSDVWELSAGPPSLNGNRPSTTTVSLISVAESKLAGALKETLDGKGLKLRPRALMTTMYARLCLGDLFLHGIGGAKYDEVTDAIMERFFQVVPPQYMTLSATLQLPVARPHVDQDDLRQINGLIRELWFHPERVSLAAACDGPSGDDFEELANQKKQHIACLPPRGDRQAWHHTLHSINQRLRQHVDDCRQRLLEERQRLAQQLRHESVLASREYSFGLYPKKTLQTLHGLANLSE